MTDYGNNNQKQAPAYAYANVPPRGNETALMIEGLYNGIAYDLQKMKKELMNELKYNALQASSLYQSVQKETDSATEANAQTIQSMVRELKYGYQQNQMIYESLSSVLTDDVLSKLGTIEGKVELLEQIDGALAEIKEKIDEFISRPQPDYDSIAETVKEKVVEALPVQEEIDYDKITESVTEKTESSLVAHNKEILDAVAAIPVAENVDYARIVEEVSEKVLEKLRDSLPKETESEAGSETVAIDYDRIIYGAAEKVVESLPYPEKVDYRRIDENFLKAAESVKTPALDEEILAANVASAVAQAISEMDTDTLAEAVASKIVLPEAHAEEIDYDKLSDMIVAKLPAPEQPEEIDYERLAETIIARMPAPVEPEPLDYEKLADAVAARMSETIDYERISETIAEKIPESESLDYVVMARQIAENMPQSEALDYAVMAQSIVEKMPQSAEPIDYDRVYQAAKAAETIPDPVDYDRIAEIFETKTSNEVDYDIVVDEDGKEAIAQGVAGALDYEELSDMVAGKVVIPEIELPKAEEIDYELLAEMVSNKIVLPEIELPKAEEIDYELLAEMVAQKVIFPQIEAPTYDVVVDEDGAKSIAECVAAAIDFDTVTDKLAEKVKVPAPEIVLPEPEALDYETLSDKVAEKIIVPQPEKTEIDYEILSGEVADKISVPSFDILVDEEGAEKIADAVVEKMRGCFPAAQPTEETAETTEETAAEAEETKDDALEAADENTEEETTADEIVSETTAEEYEPVEEIVTEEIAAEETSSVEEAAVESVLEEALVSSEENAETAEEISEEQTEPVAAAPEELLAEETNGEILSRSESTIETEIALTNAEAAAYEEMNDNLVDADTGLVIRLKRSFTAKMKQSDPAVKHYYSEIKNELTSYKKLNSNLSWHGDRFNFGRDSVAKLNICGKTLCFYLALDPNAPEYKITVYHQKDMSGQKAYENTPFMVKIKSEAALKKALRLVGFLAEKLGTEKRDNFEAVDYVEEFRHESTKQLLEEGLIKVTKEKKVVLDFN